MKRAILFALPAALAVGLWARSSGAGDPAPAPAPAARKMAPPKLQDPKVPFEKYKLDNGLEVILHQDNSVPLVAIDVWYHVGSGDETPGKSGFAHLFEHMLFQGSKNVGSDKHFEVLKSIGATSINGTTNTDRTNYFEVVPSHQIEAVMWLESDRMGYFLPMLTKPSLDNQIEVVRNERRQSYDNQPYGKTVFEVSALLYPEGHPFRHLTIGKHEDLESASLEDVKAFYAKWYVPANATLVLAGDFEMAAARKLVEKWFGGLPKTTAPEHVTPKTPVIGKKRSEVTDQFAKLRRIEYVWHSPANLSPGDAELDILSDALAQAGTGRLYKTLVHEKQLAQSVAAYQASRQHSSYFTIAVTAKTGADMAEIEKLIDEELARVREQPISQREFDRSVLSKESGFVWGLESLLTRAELLQRYNHYTGNPDYITADLDRYRTSSPDKVRDVAKKYLDPQHRAEVLTVPGKGK